MVSGHRGDAGGIPAHRARTWRGATVRKSASASGEDLVAPGADRAALRRVASLMATGVAPEELFAAVVQEIGRLLEVDYVDLSRCEPDGTITFLAVWGKTGAVFAAGARVKLGGRNATTLVAKTGDPVVIESYADASGPIGARTRTAGVRSAVGTPITVEGRLWGVMSVGWSQARSMPTGIEGRLASLTELAATAITYADSRGMLARLAEEQTALRNVATLVARGVPPEEVFAAVTEEVGRLLAVDLVNLARYEPDRTFTMLASWGLGAEHFPVGSRWPLGERTVSAIMSDTGRPARIESYDDATGPVGLEARKAGMGSAVGAPITVEDRLWGAINVASTRGLRLPADTEARLVSFTELVATALANAESRAELRASRARIVAATDQERRRVVRDLHDGAQQRVVHTIITLKLAHQALAQRQDAAPALVSEALDNAERVRDELRELAHGILPTILTRGGLCPAISDLASRTPVPVEIDVSVGRLPPAVEASAYFVVAETLTNVAKHAHADHARVTARIVDSALAVDVRDDGVGGAQPDGSGLMALSDRLAALGGRLQVDSPADGGTVVSATIPLRV
jgi:signal transduction histidine kinase